MISAAIVALRSLNVRTEAEESCSSYLNIIRCCPTNAAIEQVITVLFINATKTLVLTPDIYRSRSKMLIVALSQAQIPSTTVYGLCSILSPARISKTPM